MRFGGGGCREDFRQQCENRMEWIKSGRCNVHRSERGDGYTCTLTCCKYEQNENKKRKARCKVKQVHVRCVHITQTLENKPKA